MTESSAGRQRLGRLVQQLRPGFVVNPVLPETASSTERRRPSGFRPAFSKVLIANRGEIAVRVARACKEEGLQTIGIYAEQDSESLHLKKVDSAIKISSQNPGPIAPYLDVQSVIAAAKQAGAEAVHPGYGFLSESAEFAAACDAAGITFIGPKADTIALLGDKVRARELAISCDVPVLTGSSFLTSAQEAREFMQSKGLALPIIFKAAFGGGGRGMRLVRQDSELNEAYERCVSEAKTAFGNGAVFFEEFLDNARHIEVQIVADGQGGCAHLYERDCSVQLRNQKVVEVAPARIHPKLRQRITGCAVRLLQHCGYRGVGTVEFMVAGSLDDPDVRFVFMEVNPRIQVEHTITEEVTNVDIVKVQLCIASGATLQDLDLPGGPDNALAALRGFAIQARVSLAPGGGDTVTCYREPTGDGVRVDAALYEGCKPSVHYDPLIAKLICFAPGEGDAAFQACRKRTLGALEAYDIDGVKSNKTTLRGIMEHSEFINNEVFLSFMARHGPSFAAAQGQRPAREPTPSVDLRTLKREELSVSAPLEGTVVETRVQEGAEVAEGDLLVLLSAMKLETEVRAPAAGKVMKVCVKSNDTVKSGQDLVILDALVTQASGSTTSHARGPTETVSRQRVSGMSLADNAAVWHGPAFGVRPCEVSTATTIRLPAPRGDDGTFVMRKKHHAALIEELQQRLAVVRAGGGQKAVEQHRARGKALPRERIEAILDPGTHFLELSPLAAYDMYDKGAHSASMVTGIGLVHGQEVLFVANDATVKGGTYYPITVKKHLRAQQIAQENGLPCVYLVDSGGAYLPLQDEVFPDRMHFGRIFYNQANLSKEGLPQVSAVLGSCTAGGAYVPAMSDENIIVKGNGTIFLGGPPLVKASTGEEVTADELGGAEVHTSRSGVADHFAENEPQALAICREVLAHVGNPAQAKAPEMEPEAPLMDPEELLGIIPEDNSKALEIRNVIGRIADASRFHEFKAKYGVTLVCGFAHIHGYPVGIVANNGILFSESAQKGAHFVQLCGARQIPLLFLQNITGFMVGKAYEHGGIARDGAKLVNAVACVDVPKITVIIAGSHGAGNYGMCGRAYDPRFLFMWPNARIGVMGGAQAADVLTTVKQEQLQRQGQSPMSGKELEEFRRPTLEKYEVEGSPYHSTARLWDDGIIDPRDTRHVLGICLRICSRKPGDGISKSFGVFRM
eukprot:TRINITY_DN24097_c0_g1_i1.p1 TRINITY_DN24097_c0_g1~~TRINITY_DN24097_c0_g1_i1.p1  ORF type:complete len:1192 (-),score=196.57 TRINITY_DN24097_c0_g1_i1:42-3617(-)